MLREKESDAVKGGESENDELVENSADREKVSVDENADEAVNGSDDTNDGEGSRAIENEKGRLISNDSVTVNAVESGLLPDRAPPKVTP
jgi:hypothetical protein